MFKESKILIQISTQFSKIVHEEEDFNLSPKSLSKDKLRIFLCSQLIQESKFESALQKQMELEFSLQELTEIFLEFKQALNISDE
jgi:hypothetical protein